MINCWIFSLESTLTPIRVERKKRHKIKLFYHKLSPNKI